MKKWIWIVCMVINAECVLAGFPKGKLTVRVVDENNVPIVGAEAVALFYEAASIHTDHITDTNGQFTVKHACDGGIGGGVTKDGYYESGFGYSWDCKKRTLFTNRLKPWNPTVEVVMKEVRNPVPMLHYTGWNSLDFPVFDKEIGFDVEKGDWVVPYGKGIYSDFIFICSKMENVIQGATYKLTFSNEFDGIMEYPFDPEDHSHFKWPYEAPLTGYVNTLSKYNKYYEKTVDYTQLYPNNPHYDVIKVADNNLKKDNEINYIFRVRSEVDEDGNLIRACYGKINGEIGFCRSGSVRLRYFFNPDWTRNLEDDPKRNIRLD